MKTISYLLLKWYRCKSKRRYKVPIDLIFLQGLGLHPKQRFSCLEDKSYEVLFRFYGLATVTLLVLNRRYVYDSWSDELESVLLPQHTIGSRYAQRSVICLVRLHHTALTWLSDMESCGLAMVMCCLNACTCPRLTPGASSLHITAWDHSYTISSPCTMYTACPIFQIWLWCSWMTW